MGCGFHLTAPSLTVRCPRVSVRHRNKAACGLVVLQATLPSAHRMPTCLTCSYADALADTQNKGFFGGCLLTLQFSAARWWESNTQSAEARLERRSSGLLPLHATLLLMVGGPVSAYPMYFQGTTRPGCGGLSRTQPVEAEAHLYYLTGEVTQRRWGRQPTRASKETALRGGKADLLAAVGLLVSKGDYFFFTEKTGTARSCNCHLPPRRACCGNVSSSGRPSSAVCSTGPCEARAETATEEGVAFLRK